MKIFIKHRVNNFIFMTIVILSFALEGCTVADSPTGLSGISTSGYRMGISAIYGDTSLPADGSSQATIKVEVWDDSTGQFMDSISVTLTATLGTLGSASLTTSNGVAVTTYTAGTVVGNGSVTATVENISATATIILAKFVK